MDEVDQVVNEATAMQFLCFHGWAPGVAMNDENPEFGTAVGRNDPKCRILNRAL